MKGSHVEQLGAGVDWSALRRRARRTEVRGAREWTDLPSLRELFVAGDRIVRWEDSDVHLERGDAEAVVLRYLADVRRMGLTGRQSDFTRSMVERAEVARSLTPGQVRGVLNVLAGGLKWNRGRFWKSRGRRRDRFAGDESCIVCGGPLTTADAVARAVGDTCYRRVLGG